jgi:hypothetical protein
MNRVIILLITLVVFYFIFSKKIMFEGMDNDDILYFNNKLAGQTYADIAYEFGSASSKLDEPDGMAIWKNPSYFEEIILRDESIEHTKPSAHCDFLYVTISVFVPDNLIPKISQISQAIYYDRLKKTLTARCNSLPNTIALLFLSMKLINNPELTKEIISNSDLAIIKSSEQTYYKTMSNELETMVRENQDMFISVMPNKKCYIPNNIQDINLDRDITHTNLDKSYNKPKQIHSKMLSISN